MNISVKDIPMIIFLLLIIYFIITTIFQTKSYERYDDLTDILTDDLGTGTGTIVNSYQENLSVRALPQTLQQSLPQPLNPDAITITDTTNNNVNLDEGSTSDPSYQISVLKASNDKLKQDVQTLTNIIGKFYTTDSTGEYIVNGWFVEFHNLLDAPGGMALGETLQKVYGAPLICFRVKDGYPFLGPPDKPMFFPKQNNIGFRAMTILKIPYTGYYDFKVLTDDGMRLYYQKVSSTVILNEKNVRSPWQMIIDSWLDQAEVWITSKKIYFNQNDLIFIRMDYYQLSGYASACIKLRRYRDDIVTNNPDNDHIQEMDLPYKNTYCSLLWSEVPLLGFI